MAARRLKAVTSFGVPLSGGALFYPTAGTVWFVDHANGKTSARGDDYRYPARGLDRIFERVESNDLIYVKGDLRHQIVAPLGVYGVKIIGAVGGRPRHTTSGGVELAGNGVAWREEATALNAPLIELREQGWEIHDILMLPQTGYSSVKLHRAESATYPDASHAKFRGVKFLGGDGLGTPGGYGIEDVGGAHNVEVAECEFTALVGAWLQTSIGIATPLRNIIRDCLFRLNTADISMDSSGGSFLRNSFRTPYNVTTHPTTINLAKTGSTTYGNDVFDNRFADAAAGVSIAQGYKKGNTSDRWRNKVTDTAADIVTVPA